MKYILKRQTILVQFLDIIGCREGAVKKAIAAGLPIKVALDPWLSIVGSSYLSNLFALINKLIADQTFASHIEAINAMRSLTIDQVAALIDGIPYEFVLSIPVTLIIIVDRA